jgi:hypothetical protein
MPENLISSWADLQRTAPETLRAINDDDRRSLAAAANPLFAVEELGYRIDPPARQEIEDRIRFRPRSAARLRTLRTAIYEQAGREFDLQSGAELREVLVGLLGSGRSAGEQEQGTYALPKGLDTKPLPPQVGWGTSTEDPLERLRGAHPVMEPLLEYRRLEASEPRLASRKLYQDLRSGKREASVTRLRGRFKDQPD